MAVYLHQEASSITQDYRGEAVTAANFLSVLAGEEPAVIGTSGRTVKSGPDDRVFVFYADHGAPGTIHGICTVAPVADVSTCPDAQPLAQLFALQK